ncbi:MAG: nitroreductase [Smithella sp.]
MELTTAVKERCSIRKFKTIDIPRNLVEQILDVARWSPSWGNTQPWEFYVLTGESLEKYKEMNRSKQEAGEAPFPDVRMPQKWPDILKKRYEESVANILIAQGIKREDKAARNQYYREMASLFGAPCLILACIPQVTSVEYAMLDMGLIIQTMCLLAHEKGLGTCIMASAVLYPSAIREIASIPDDKKIIAGIALGYPDPAFSSNAIERKRAEITEIFHWLE